MDDDFNTPILIAHLFEGVKQINLIEQSQTHLTQENLAEFSKMMKIFAFDLLGLENEISTSNTRTLDDVINMLIRYRNQARDDKNWILSDEIRDELASYGVQLKDGKDGTTFLIN